eukprot:CAMPEP_0170835034 /NCGR_PEP_ID=MMETSP0734-20130129/1312_1 /TAXON_ID=186038 /ORGANISM="Fragilariopsis kerguelensis, Strain L26-C5" /LENGTH=62 /DNA_ID=CAMNT_0011201715 /DNA_START=38 /DNA_END=223 /DNA_ORIENTATION=+
MTIAGLTGSTVAAEGSIQLRGAAYSSDGINRQLQAETGAFYTAPDAALRGTSGGTGSTYTPP